MPKSKTHFAQVPIKLVEKIMHADLPEGETVALPKKNKARAPAEKRVAPTFVLLEKTTTAR